jgi:hypothetical protein
MAGAREVANGPRAKRYAFPRDRCRCGAAGLRCDHLDCYAHGCRRPVLARPVQCRRCRKVQSGARRRQRFRQGVGATRSSTCCRIAKRDGDAGDNGRAPDDEAPGISFESRALHGAGGSRTRRTTAGRQHATSQSRNHLEHAGRRGCYFDCYPLTATRQIPPRTIQPAG